MIFVQNDGQNILDTNYFASDFAKAGLMFVSINAGAFRLLLPAHRPHMAHTWRAILDDARTASHVIVTRGTSGAGLLKVTALELLFEDGSDSPFVITIGRNQFDILPAVADHGRTDLSCSIWVLGADGSPCKELELPARFRWVASLPCLKKWDGPAIS